MDRSTLLSVTGFSVFLVGTLCLSIPLLPGTAFSPLMLPTSSPAGEPDPESRPRIPNGITFLNETHYVLNRNLSQVGERMAYYTAGAWTIDWVPFFWWWKDLNGTQSPPVDVRLKAEIDQYADRVNENLAQIPPSFTCTIRDPYHGIIYVLLADLRDQEKVLAIIQPPEHIPVKFVQVNYSLTQLMEWKLLLRHLFFNGSSPLYQAEALEQELGLDVAGIGLLPTNASIIIDVDIWTDEEGAKLTETQKDALLLHHVHLFADHILTPYTIPWDAVWFMEVGNFQLHTSKSDIFCPIIGGLTAVLFLMVFVALRIRRKKRLRTKELYP